MKKECEIVQDLLFGYNDETISKSSKELVEKHLKDCKDCQEMLNQIKSDDTNKNIENKEIDYLKGIKNKLNKKTIYITITSIIIFILVVFNICVFATYNNSATTVQVFLEEDITSEEMKSIQDLLEKKSKDNKVNYYSEDEQFEELKEKLGDNADLLSEYDSSILAKEYSANVDKENIEEVIHELEKMNGIKKVLATGINENPYTYFWYNYILKE